MKKKDTDIKGIESLLDEIKEDIETNNLDKASDRMLQLSSMTIVAGDSDLYVIDGIIRVCIDRLGFIVDLLKTIMENDMMEREEADGLFGMAQAALADMTVISKDYLHHRNKTKFFDSVAQGYYTLQEIKETLRLGVRD